MIFVVHSLYFLIKFTYKLYKKHQALKEFRALKAEQRLMLQEEEVRTKNPDFEESIRFDPPVYRQRYLTIQQILLDERWRKRIRKIIDFGCAEFGFFTYIKHLKQVNEIYEVDIDKAVMEANKFKLQPLTADYLRARTQPLEVRVFRGSISDPDYRLKDVDAVIGIEIIEHLYPDTLDAMCYNIFGYIKPQLAIFTTPNADFNILFSNFNGFRHYDHKFEWTREQFEDWALNVTTRFPSYSVRFEGIGPGPRGSESLGCCSQMAIFVKEYDIVSDELAAGANGLGCCDVVMQPEQSQSFGVCTYFSYSKQIELFNDQIKCDLLSECDNCFYKLIDTITYPCDKDERSVEQKILDEAMYNIYKRASYDSRFYNKENGMVEIPLNELTANIEGHFVSEAELGKLLEAAHIHIEECASYGNENAKVLCVIYDMEKSGSDIESDDHNNGEEDDEGYDAALLRRMNAAADDADDVDDVDDGVVVEEEDWDLGIVTTTVHHHNQKDKGGGGGGGGNGQQSIVLLSPLSSNPDGSDQLIDSGYQKSISNTEWSPQSPMDGLLFESDMVNMKMDVNDIRDNLKGGSSTKKLPMKDPIPGTSELKKRRRLLKKSSSSGGGGGGRNKDSDDEEDEATIRDDVKTIAKCIIYNSLNRINVEVEDEMRPIIADMPLAQQEVPLVVGAVAAVAVAAAPAPPAEIVENGDLANNNRDNEGNNYAELIPNRIEPPAINENNINANIILIEEEEEEDVEEVNLRLHANNVEHLEEANLRRHNLEHLEEVNLRRHNVEQLEELNLRRHNVEQQQQLKQPLVDYQNDEEEAPEAAEDVEDVDGVNHASCEALFDPNSQIDMLEEEEEQEEVNIAAVPPDAEDAEVAAANAVAENILLVGSHERSDVVIPDNNLFPHWLLQLFGHAGDEDGEGGEDENHDEPHFYCQGDGLGVHPSIIDVEVEDDTVSESSSNDDEAQAERTLSSEADEEDIGSLSVDQNNSEALEVVGHAVVDANQLQLRNSTSAISSTDSTDEFYDIVDDDTNNCSGASK